VSLGSFVIPGSVVRLLPVPGGCLF
jgi:hypothetical protein